MKKELKVLEFNRKQKLIDFVNSNPDKFEVVSITSSREEFSYNHFLWYYEK